MFNHTKKYYLRSLLSAFIFVLMGFAFVAQASDSTVKGLDEAAGKAKIGKESKMVQDIPSAIGRVIGIVLSFIGLAFFVLMVYGGVIWMFARGNDQEVSRAKDLIQSAIIGLIIVLSAYALTIFVGNALTSGAVTAPN